MRHGKADCKLGRTTSHRKAMLRNMVTSFIEHESIKTTDTKAKELKKVAEKMVTLGKKGSLHARRQALGYIRSAETVRKLFDELSVRYRERAGGYTRIVKLGFRAGDSAPVSLVEFVKDGEKEKSRKKTGAAKKS
ncbi:MAG TPA: 50S ribosomal protein L17 [Syntrophales bacterium]|nr:50S ribosomal protein L17 [Syntrophales bacterium]HON24170.1 50S ribosomal protein L17 [Syntrophales bacterium]HOU77993.1 50S ribosomal protein L17 [Syntrophales bacterium]HPC32190.1 50S ribosomal protein L17 [Syntrophales bacterium]HQG33908.1 50S ribosomal protein L17 [Syntrophales bacterium]